MSTAPKVLPLYAETEKMLRPLSILNSPAMDESPVMIALAFYVGTPPRLSSSDYPTRRDYERERKRVVRQLARFTALFSQAWHAGVRDPDLLKHGHKALKWSSEFGRWYVSGGHALMGRESAIEILEAAIKRKGGAK